MSEWGVPTSIVGALRNGLGAKLADRDPVIARGALRAVFEEQDSWSEYVDEYEGTMTWSARILTGLVGTLVLASLVAFCKPWAVPFGVFLAGAAGGCVSVLSRMPPLAVSVELAAYRRLIFIRACTGLVASLIGCAMLAWGVIAISFQSQTFGDVLDACADGSCTPARVLILTGIPLLIGFSEQALMSFEGRLFGNSSLRREARGISKAS